MGRIGEDFHAPVSEDWHTRAVCYECQFSVDAPAGELLPALDRFGCCPKCGVLIVREFATVEQPPGHPFQIIRCRWVDAAIDGSKPGFIEKHPEDL